MKKILSLILILSIFLSISIQIFAASEDGTWYDTAFTITDFYNIPVVNCDCDEGLVYKFTAPATATYTIVSISEYDIYGQLEDSDWDSIVWYGSSSDESGDFELVADLTKGETYYIWTNPEGVDVASYTMQISYEMKSGYYTYDVYTNECVITNYSGSATSLALPSSLGGKKVIGLADEAFLENTTLKSVTFPSTLKTLGYECFRNCTSLTTVNLNEGLVYIDAYAFESCAALTSITIPSTVHTIYSMAFRNCSSLTDVVFQEGLECIQTYAFRNCTSLKKISLPSSMTQVSNYAFMGCTALESIDIDEGLEIIKKSAFRDCISLKEVVLPESLTEINTLAFSGCTSLTNATFLNPDTTFTDVDVFSKCTNVTIHGYTGSSAQIYADTNSIPFECLDEYIPIQDFDIEERVLYLKVGETYQLTIEFVPDNATNKNITWQVDDDGIISLTDNGTITALNVGETVISASINDVIDGVTTSWMTLVNIFVEEDENLEEPDDIVSVSSAFRVYEPVYEYVRQFQGDYVSVYNKGVYSLIDSQNNAHYSSDQDGFGNYSEEIIPTYNAENDEIVFNNLDGYAFTLSGYKWAGDFLGGKCVVMNSDGLLGLIDSDGNFIIECVYDEIRYDTSDTVLVCKDSTWTSISLAQSVYSLRTAAYANELYTPELSVTAEHIIASDGTAYGILTSDNVQITEFKYDLIRDAQNGLFIGYYGDFVDLIDLDGTVTATLTAYYVGAHSENKIAVYNGSNFFYVDKYGKSVVNVNIEDVISAEEFHESYAVINVDGKGYTYINTSGVVATETYWDYAARFADGYALVMNYFHDNDGNSLRKWSIIDQTFNVVMTLEDDIYIDPTYEHSADFSDGYIRTVDRDTGLMGFIRLDEFDFDDELVKPGLCVVSGSITSYGDADEVVTVILYDADGTEIDSDTTTDGTYTLSAPDGTYTLEVSKTKHATREYSVTVDSDDITQNVEIWLYGDINKSGTVDGNDAAQIYRYVAGKKSAFTNGDAETIAYRLIVADVNRSSVVDGNDAAQIYRYVAGKKSAFNSIP